MKYRIRAIRKSKKWKIEKLAAMIGTSSGNLSNIETGKRGCSLQMLTKIARALDVSEPELFVSENYKEQQAMSLFQDIMNLSLEHQDLIRQHVRLIRSSTE